MKTKPTKICGSCNKAFRSRAVTKTCTPCGRAALSGYWSQSITASVAADYAAGNVVTLVAGA